MKALMKHGVASVLTATMAFSVVGTPVAFATSASTGSTSNTTVTGSNSLSSLLQEVANRLGTSGGSSSKGTLTVVKVDADNRSVKLPGAEFTVYKDSNGNGAFDAGTDQAAGTMAPKNGSDGEYELSGLDAGTYFVLETKAPDNYDLNPNIYKAELKSNGSVSAEPAGTTANGTTGTTDGSNSVIDPTVLTQILQQTINNTNKSIADGLNNVAGSASQDLNNLSLDKFVSEQQVQSLVDALSAQAKTTVNQGYNSLVPVLNETYGLGKDAIVMIANLLLAVLNDADESPVVEGVVNFGTEALGAVATALGGQATGTALSAGSKQLINGGIALLSSVVSAFTPIITNLMNSGLDVQALEFIENIIGNILQNVTGSSVIDSVADAGISTAYNIADGILQAGGATAAQSNEAIAQTIATLIQNPALANSATSIADTAMNVFNSLNPLNTLQIGSDQQSALATALQTLTGIANVSGIGDPTGISNLLNNALAGLTSADIQVDGATIEIADTHSKGDVVIDKGDSATKDPVSGATYTVYADTDGNGKFNSSIDQIVTNLGETTSDGHYVGTVKTGTYFIKETTPATGYAPDNNVYKVTIESVADEASPTQSQTVQLQQNASGNTQTPVASGITSDGTAVQPATLGSGSSDTNVSGSSGAKSYSIQTDTGNGNTTQPSTSADNNVVIPQDNSGNDDPVVEAASTPDTGVSVVVPLALMATSSTMMAGLYVSEKRKEETEE